VTDASDAPPPLPTAATPAHGADRAATAAPVLARGHLHPGILLLRLLDALRQAAFPVVAGLVLQSWWFVGFGVLGFVLYLGYAIARYVTLEYTLTADELRVREGLLERQERRIPLDRIQDLGFESSLLRRALGLCVVLVETASGRGVAARLDALARGDAEHLREVLLAARARAEVRAPNAAADDLAPAPPAPEWIVHQSRGAELTLRGLTDLRLSAMFVTGYAALELADSLGVAVRLAGAARSAQEWLARFPPSVMAAILFGVLFVVMAFGVGTSVVGNLVTFHGFTLTLRGDVLQRRFGLLTTRQKTLPRARVQRVTYEQTWLRRLLGCGVVKADSAGGSRSEGEDTAGGWDVVVPLARDATAAALLPALLPGLERARFAWQRGSVRLVARMGVQGAALAAIATAALWPHNGPLALFALLLLPAWAVLGVLVWRNLGFALDAEFLALRHGVLGRATAILPMAKVQAVVVRQGPVEQALGLASLTVYVAGGSPTCVPDLLLADARTLARDIGTRAAVAAAATW
jgi:putative membrane protein